MGEFDALVRYNRALEEAFPELVRKDTPEAQVGAKPQSGFGEVCMKSGCVLSQTPLQMRMCMNLSRA